MKTHLKTVTRLLCSLLVLLCLLSTTACTQITEDVDLSREFGEAFLDAILADDPDTAFALIEHIATREEFESLWSHLRQFFEEASSYELKFTGWKSKLSNQIKTTQVAFQITTDNGKTCQMTVVTQTGIDGVAGVQFA